MARVKTRRRGIRRVAAAAGLLAAWMTTAAGAETSTMIALDCRAPVLPGTGRPVELRCDPDLSDSGFVAFADKKGAYRLNLNTGALTTLAKLGDTLSCDPMVNDRMMDFGVTRVNESGHVAWVTHFCPHDCTGPMPTCANPSPIWCDEIQLCYLPNGYILVDTGSGPGIVTCCAGALESHLQLGNFAMLESGRVAFLSNHAPSALDPCPNDPDFPKQRLFVATPSSAQVAAMVETVSPQPIGCTAGTFRYGDHCFGGPGGPGKKGPIGGGGGHGGEGGVAGGILTGIFGGMSSGTSKPVAFHSIVYAEGVTECADALIDLHFGDIPFMCSDAGVPCTTVVHPMFFTRPDEGCVECFDHGGPSIVFFAKIGTTGECDFSLPESLVEADLQTDQWQELVTLGVPYPSLGGAVLCDFEPDCTEAPVGPSASEQLSLFCTERVGRAVFAGHYRTGQSCIDAVPAIFLCSGQDQVTILRKAGDLIPSSTTIRYTGFGQPVINSEGEVVFWASWEVGTSTGGGIFLIDLDVPCD